MPPESHALAQARIDYAQWLAQERRRAREVSVIPDLESGAFTIGRWDPPVFLGIKPETSKHAIIISYSIMGIHG